MLKVSIFISDFVYQINPQLLISNYLLEIKPGDKFPIKYSK